MAGNAALCGRVLGLVAHQGGWSCSALLGLRASRVDFFTLALEPSFQSRPPACCRGWNQLRRDYTWVFSVVAGCCCGGLGAWREPQWNKATYHGHLPGCISCISRTWISCSHKSTRFSTAGRCFIDNIYQLSFSYKWGDFSLLPRLPGIHHWAMIQSLYIYIYIYHYQYPIFH